VARVLFVNQYYWPDFASTGQHLTDLAEHLAASGHEVRVVCSRGRYLEGRGGAPVRERRNGVDVRRVRATSFGKRRHAGRLADYLTFHLAAGARVALSRWADVVVTLTTPPLVGWIGAAARALGGARHVNFVMDLHPDAEFEHGMIRRESLAGRALEAAAARILRGADANVVLGPYQGERVAARGVPAERIHEIPVWSDGDEIHPVEHADNPLRARLGWSGRFVVVYSGNAGLVHTFDEVLDAAQRLAETDPDVLFAFVGAGPRTPEIEAAARRLPNVELHGYFPREELAHSLSAADAHFMSLRPEHVGVAVPGKLYGILAAGRPVLFVGSERCESADTIRAARAGATFAPGEGAALAAEVRALRDDPARRAELGRNGRDWFLRVHERGVCVESWRELLEAVAGERPAAAPDDVVLRPGADVDRIAAALPAPRPEARVRR
jgi:glycosyltransferase involved in cell wall biosynthesis